MRIGRLPCLAAWQVTEEDREVGRVFPALHRMRTVSAHIAKAVANKAYELGESGCQRACAREKMD